MTLLELISPSLLLNKPLLILIPLVAEIPTPSPTVAVFVIGLPFV